MSTVLAAEPQAIEFDPRRSALCVIDMQNWDVKPGGFLALTGQDITHGQSVVEPIRRALAGARAAKMPVVYTKNIVPRDRSRWPDRASPWYAKAHPKQYAAHEPELERGMCLEGSWGADIIEELAPLAAEVVVPKSAFSGFVRTELDVVLRRLDVRYLFLTGIGTPTCVDATARDAYFHEYWTILLEDCCAAKERSTHQQALEPIKRRYGWVSSSELFLAALEAAR